MLVFFGFDNFHNMFSFLFSFCNFSEFAPADLSVVSDSMETQQTLGEAERQKNHETTSF